MTDVPHAFFVVATLYFVLSGNWIVAAIFGANSVIDNLFVASGSSSRPQIRVLFRAGGAQSIGGVTPNVTLNFANVDIEAAASGLKTVIMFDQVNGVINNGDFECGAANATCQPITIQGLVGTPGLTLNNAGLSAANTAASVIHVIGNPINIFNNVQNKASVPLTDGGSSIIDGGTGTGMSPGISAPAYGTGTNCSSSGSPAICGNATAGSVALPTGTNPTLVVNTTAVTANSQILLNVDESLGTKLGVTCNTTLSTLPNPVVTARNAGTSFTFTVNATIAVNPACVSYLIIN